MKKIGIASDHAGFLLKQFLIKHLQERKFEITDFGANSEESVDYPDFAHPLAKAVAKNEGDIGIAICGSGNGINMTVNKHNNIRAALCWTSEIAMLARQHNDANICTLPARFINEKTALEIINTFLSTKFEAGRHQNRIDKINT